jgi:hypothetical protein
VQSDKVVGRGKVRVIYACSVSLSHALVLVLIQDVLSFSEFYLPNSYEAIEQKIKGQVINLNSIRHQLTY